MAKLTIRDIDVKDKRVLVRVDFNVPMNEDTGELPTTAGFAPACQPFNIWLTIKQRSSFVHIWAGQKALRKINSASLRLLKGYRN